MFSLCCFAHSTPPKGDPQKLKPPNLLEEPAENLEAFKEGLRSISTPATSFQKVAAPDESRQPRSFPLAQSSRKSKKKSATIIGPPHNNIEVFERRQFEAYKEEVEKRRRLQLVERQMALFNTWEFYNEQEMWDLLVRYNQYIQTGHQIFLTPMPDCPIHGHSISGKHQPTKRHNNKKTKQLKQRRRPSAGSLSDEQSSPYASHYSDNQRSDRSRSSITSQVSAEIHSVSEKFSLPSALKSMTLDRPIPSDMSEKDSGIDKNSLNSSIGNGSSVASSRKSTERSSKVSSQLHKLNDGVEAAPIEPENDYDLDVPCRVDEEKPEYRDYREGIYYAREEIKNESAFGAIWEGRASPTTNTYEDINDDDDEDRNSADGNTEDVYEAKEQVSSPVGSFKKPRQRNENDGDIEPPKSVYAENLYGESQSSTAETEVNVTEISDETPLHSLRKDDDPETGHEPEPVNSSELYDCKGDQCSPSKVMLRSLNLSSHNLTEIPSKSSPINSLERKNDYSKVNKNDMRLYDITAQLRDSTTPPPPPPLKRIEALINDEIDFYDDSREQPENRSSPPIEKPSRLSVAAAAHQNDDMSKMDLPKIHIRESATQSSPPASKRSTSDTAHNARQEVDAPRIETGKVEEECKIMFEMPKLRDVSERKITPIREESSEISIRSEIQKVITKLHKTGGWRKATCTPGEPYLTLDLRKETKPENELPIPTFETRPSSVQTPTDISTKASAVPSKAAAATTPRITTAATTTPRTAAAATTTTAATSRTTVAATTTKTATTATKTATAAAASVTTPSSPTTTAPSQLPEQVEESKSESEKTYSRIDMEALDFKKAREALKKFTNDGSNPLLRQMPNRPLASVASFVPDESAKTSSDVNAIAKSKIFKSVSAPPELKPPCPVAETNPQSPPATEVIEEDDSAERAEEDDRINFQAARETLQRLTSLNNGMFFMTDRKSRPPF